MKTNCVLHALPDHQPKVSCAWDVIKYYCGLQPTVLWQSKYSPHIFWHDGGLTCSSFDIKSVGRSASSVMPEYVWWILLVF